MVDGDFAVGIDDLLRVRRVGHLDGFVNQLEAAQASAFCSSVTTPEISLNGLVYWFA